MSSPAPTTAGDADRGDRLGLVIAVGLALVGLLGALVAWRVVDLGGDAGGAARSAQAAAREHSRAVLAAEGTVTGAHAAWIAYELDRRRAEELRAADQFPAALRADKAAAAHWGFVDAGYVGSDGLYQAADHRDGYVARQGEQLDLDAAPHLVAAVDAEDRAMRLSLVAMLIAAALPLLTVAEVTRGRARLAGAVAGGTILAGGTLATLLLWA